MLAVLLDKDTPKRHKTKIQLTSVPVMSKSRSFEPGASPMLTPAMGAINGTPASSNARLDPHALAMEDEPFELVTSHVIRIA